MEVEAVPLPSGDFSKRLPSVTTRQDGRFSYIILPGAKYTLQGQGGGLMYAVLAGDLAIEPGQTIDLGDLRIGSDGKVMEKPASDAAATPNAGETGLPDDSSESATAEPRTTTAEAKVQPQSARSYSGRVTDTDGQPIAGAAVWMAFYTGEAEHEQLLRTVATYNQDGQFRFTLDPEARRLIDAARSPWQGQLIAVAPAHGVDWLPRGVFEDDPVLTSGRDEMIAHLTSTIGAERLESRSLRLQPASRPVRGQLVDLEGRPRPNVVVRVESVMQPDVPLLLQAFEEKSKQRYFDAVNRTSVGGDIDRLHVYQLFPPVTTDADGRFELTGIGEDQLANLSINAPGVEAQVIHILGRPIESARLPHFDRYPGGAKDVFYGWDFTHAVGPSIPVVGVVKEFDSGKPIANT
ncbi:MAG: hypothetical protein WD176_01750, partial [Pirellulales bacterium]